MWRTCCVGKERLHRQSIQPAIQRGIDSINNLFNLIMIDYIENASENHELFNLYMAIFIETAAWNIAVALSARRSSGT